MKKSMWKIFALLAIVMTFGFAQTSWAGDRICQDEEDDPLGIVTGVIAIPDDTACTDRDCWEVTTEDEATVLVICGVPDYLGLEALQEETLVTFTYDVRPCAELVACTVDDGTGETMLRPQKNKDQVSDTLVTVTNGVCDCSNCGLHCNDDCPYDECCELTCTCKCEE